MTIEVRLTGNRDGLIAKSYELALQSVWALGLTEDDIYSAYWLEFIPEDDTNITEEFKSRLRGYSNAG